MTSKSMPVPPANRSDKGPGGDDSKPVNPRTEKAPEERSVRTGRHANIRQNTKNQGYQQDR
jgi:hypothetical protein